MVIKSNEYISELGLNFLSWDEWAHTTLNDADLAIYNDGADPDLLVSSEKNELHLRWMKDQKITCHIMYADGVETHRTYFTL
jgi:hypothetical protein